jgi:hypothetical protein
MEGQPGWKWGESGKCYPYTPKDEESENKAKQRAYIQGYAMGELTEMEEKEWIPIETELANIIDVPVLTSGEFLSHNAGPLIITEADLDEIIRGSNELQPIIQEAIETGAYRGNEEITEKLTKPIPGLLNFKHQSILPETLKKATQGVKTAFKKASINGKNWIIQQFQNVPNDIADTIQREFPFRSVELLPLKDPNTGKTYPKIIRSTAFLDKFTLPAVPGQSSELIVEFMGTEKEPLTIITTTGVNIMTEKKQDEKTVDVAELQKMQATLTEMQAELVKVKEDRKKAIELAKTQEANNQKLTHDVVELRSQNYLQALSRLRKKEDGLTYQISPAFLDIIKPIIEGNGVVELAEGQSSQDAMYKLFDEIAEMGGNIVIQLSTEGKKSYSQPEDKKPDKQALIQELMETEHLTENEAWVKATDRLNEYKTTEVQ